MASAPAQVTPLSDTHGRWVRITLGTDLINSCSPIGDVAPDGSTIDREGGA